MRRLSNQSGAMLIQVGISIMVLMGLTVFVFDNGLLWTARGQAQNSADAGALAGAVARAYDELDDPPATGGMAETIATTVATRHEIWNEPGTTAVSWDCPPGVAGGGCVQVDVFRNGENGSNTLPRIFGALMGVASHGVKATATAQAIPANAASCLKPWGVADKWQEASGEWTQQSVYQPANGDVYIPPSGSDPGTGFSRTTASGDPEDWGMQLPLKIGNSGPPGSPGTLSAGWSMALDLPNAENPEYRNNISGCTTVTVGIADPSRTCTAADPEGGCIKVNTGATVGQATQDGLQHIMDSDPNAYWDRTANRVVSTFPSSPRIVPVAVFDTAAYVAANCSGSQCYVKVVNFLGFFIEGICKNLTAAQKEDYLHCSPNQADIIGRLVTFPGTHIQGGTSGGPAAFGVIIRLVR